jgi:hypothetical protein
VNQNVLILCYFGVSNYELTYREVVILLDAGIDKSPWWRPTGVSREDMIAVAEPPRWQSLYRATRNLHALR